MSSEFAQRQKNDFFRDMTSLGSLWIYLIAVLYFLFVQEYILLGKLVFGLILIYAIVIITRTYYFKERPKKYPYKTYIERLDASSFPSLHSARIVFLSGMLFNYFDNVMISIILLALIMLAAYSRIYFKKHDYKDILGGIILGIFVYLIVELLF